MSAQKGTSFQWMLYGAYGVTGRLILEYARQRGHRPLLAGRDKLRLADLAARSGLDSVHIDFEAGQSAFPDLSGISAVLNAAGPYFQTGKPLRESCLSAGVSYLDVNGEISDFLNALACDKRARERGVAVIPGAGFGVVFGEALAGHVASQLPDATWLRISLAPATDASSIGAMRSTASALADGGYVVRAGSLLRRPTAYSTWKVSDPGPAGRSFRFAEAPRAELIAAQRLTGVPNITAGVALPLAAAIVLRLTGRFVGTTLMRMTEKRRSIQATRAEFAPHGVRSRVFAEAGNDKGVQVASVLETGEGYHVAAVTAVHAVEQLMALRPIGALTPVQAFGVDLALSVPGTAIRAIARADIPGAVTPV